MKRIRINTGKIGLVFRNGNYRKVVTEGAYWLLPNVKAGLSTALRADC